MSSIQHVSDTAFWVATHRAAESERPDALFQDPLAKVLIGDRGEKIAHSMRSIAKYSSWTLAIRTRLIDEMIQDYIRAGCKTIINLGAGLDTRPYRLDLPEDVHWIEIDFPGVIEMKNEKLKGETPRCQLERVALDVAQRSERRKFFNDLNARITPALVLTEGVIPYLTEETVAELADDLNSLSQIRFWIAEYYSPRIYARYQSPKFSRLLGNSPFQFYPSDWFGFFKKHGWVQKEIRYLYDLGEKLGRSFPLPWYARLIRFFVGKENFAERIRLHGYFVLRKSE